MNFANKCALIAVTICLPLSAQAHRAWMLPSTTVLSGEEPWVTVDAAVSNDLFYFEHFPMQLEGVGTPAAAGESERQRRSAPLRITAPDGTQVDPQNGHIGRYRSTFDVQLMQKGTYKLSIAGEPRFGASYQLDGERKRWMGDLKDLNKSIPKNAEKLDVSRNDSRMEVFITSGNPTETVFKPTNQGLELQPLTHPNDLFAGETARFRFLIDGKPAANVEVSVIPGGNRYRDALGEMNLKTDGEGVVGITWPEAGMYWMEAEYETTEGLEAPLNRRRASYTSTLEVLAP